MYVCVNYAMCGLLLYNRSVLHIQCVNSCSFKLLDSKMFFLINTASAYVSVYPFIRLSTYPSPTTDWKQKKLKGSQAVALVSYKGLAEVAARCLCELLVALPHFNFHNNIIVAVVALMNEPAKKAS